MPDITDWCGQQEKTHSNIADFSIAEWDLFPIIPCGVGVEGSHSLVQDVTGWRQSTVTHKTILEEVVVRQFGRDDSGILGGNNAALNTAKTEHNFVMKRVVGERKSRWMAIVHSCLVMSQGSLNVCATKKESCTRNKKTSAMAACTLHSWMVGKEACCRIQNCPLHDQCNCRV